MLADIRDIGMSLRRHIHVAAFLVLKIGQASIIMQVHQLLLVLITIFAKAFAESGDAVNSVSKELTVTAASVIVDGGKESTRRQVEETRYPDVISTPLSADGSAIFQVTLSVENEKDGTRPQTTALRLRCTETDTAVLLAASKGSTAGIFTIKSSFEAVQAQLGFGCPTLEATALLGDEALAKSVAWDLGRFEVDYSTAAAKGKAGLGRPQTHMQKLFQPQPTISHHFRQPDRRPSAAISMLFAAVTALPLLLLVAALLRLRVNLLGFPTQGLSLVAAIAFHGGLAALLGLYALFWLQLNLLETLPILAVNALFLLMSGYKLLSLQADARLKSS